MQVRYKAATGADSMQEQKNREPCGSLTYLVVGKGLEPPARGFSIRCSTN